MGKIKLELSFYIKAHIYNFILVHYYITVLGMNTHPSCKEAELGVSKQHEAENTQEFHVVYQFILPCRLQLLLQFYGGLSDPFLSPLPAV